MNDVRVLIVAEDPLARAGLAAWLSEQPGCDVVGRVSARDDLKAALEAYRPDVLVWDLGWDPTEDLDRIAGLTDTVPPVAALVPDEIHAIGAWASGARAILSRDIDATSLSAAVTAVSRGMLVLSPELASAISRTRGQLPPKPVEQLTPRELQVLRLLAEGLPNKAIADQLDISHHTVKFHVNSILSKLDARSRTEAVVSATRHGLILV